MSGPHPVPVIVNGYLTHGYYVDDLALEYLPRIFYNSENGEFYSYEDDELEQVERIQSSSSRSRVKYEGESIDCEKINSVPGFENFSWPSTTYVQERFGPSRLWAPPTIEEVEFWRNTEARKNQKKADIEIQEQKAKEIYSPPIMAYPKVSGDHNYYRPENPAAVLVPGLKGISVIPSKFNTRTRMYIPEQFGNTNTVDISTASENSSGDIIHRFQDLWSGILGGSGDQNLDHYSIFPTTTRKAQRSTSNQYIANHYQPITPRLSSSVENCRQTSTPPGKVEAEISGQHISISGTDYAQGKLIHASISLDSGQMQNVQPNLSSSKFFRRHSTESFPKYSMQNIQNIALEQLRSLDEEQIAEESETEELLDEDDADSLEENVTSKQFNWNEKSSKFAKDSSKPIIEIREGDEFYTKDGEKREYLCVFCKGNNEPESVYKSHPIRVNGIVMCPFLRNHTCFICKETGHTIKYCKNNKRGFFAMKSIGKTDVFLTAEKKELAQATMSALAEATTSGKEEDKPQKEKRPSRSIRGSKQESSSKHRLSSSSIRSHSKNSKK